MAVALSITIIRYVDDGFPGWVECELLDAFGRRHRFMEKVPVVTRESLLQESSYPCGGTIACELVSAWADEEGYSLTQVDTSSPWGIESMDGVIKFTVPSALLSPNVILS
ncbi:hypothetical protein [Luteolibacter sp. Populi]|uniref:hypothetical protein n=1 Tax=Luteolibacter sp. Populi TaxID=3230487 RepID=UPI0034655676